MLSLVAPRVVFLTACGATSKCGVVTLTASPCSSVYALRILIVPFSTNATPKFCTLGMGLSVWRLCRRLWPRVVFVAACGATGRCRVGTLTTPLCSRVYTLRICMPSGRGQGRHVYVIYVLLYYVLWLIDWSPPPPCSIVYTPRI